MIEAVYHLKSLAADHIILEHKMQRRILSACGAEPKEENLIYFASAS
jgi:hypothetical protein